MPYEGSRGKQCIVTGCYNNQRDIYNWKMSICEQHGEKHEHCICVAPLRFFCLPKDTERRREWLRVINRLDYNPAGRPLVCCRHFEDGAPSKENPLPSRHMSYENMTAPKPWRLLNRKPIVPPTKNENKKVKQVLMYKDHRHSRPVSDQNVRLKVNKRQHVYTEHSYCIPVTTINSPTETYEKKWYPEINLDPTKVDTETSERKLDLENVETETPGKEWEFTTLARETLELEADTTIVDTETHSDTETHQSESDFTTLAKETLEIESDSITVYTEMPERKWHFTTLETDTTEIKCDPTTVESGTSEIKCDPTTVESGTSEIKCDPTTVESGTSELKCDPTTVESGTSEIKCDPTTVESDTTELKCDPTTVESETSEIKCDKTTVHTVEPVVKWDQRTLTTKRTKRKWETTLSGQIPSQKLRALSFEPKKSSSWTAEEKQHLKDYVWQVPRGRESLAEYWDKCATSFQHSSRNGHACKGLAQRMGLVPTSTDSKYHTASQTEPLQPMNCTRLKESEGEDWACIQEYDSSAPPSVHRTATKCRWQDYDSPTDTEKPGLTDVIWRKPPFGSYYQVIVTDQPQDDAIRDLFRKNGWTLHSKALSEYVVRTLLHNEDEDIASFIQSTCGGSISPNMQEDDIQQNSQSASEANNMSMDSFEVVKTELHNEPVRIKTEPESEPMEEQNGAESCENAQMNMLAANDAAENMNTAVHFSLPQNHPDHPDDFVVVKNEPYDEHLYGVQNEIKVDSELYDDLEHVKTEPDVESEDTGDKIMCTHNTAQFVVKTELYDEPVLESESFGIQNKSESEHDLNEPVCVNRKYETESGFDIEPECKRNKTTVSAENAESTILEEDRNSATDFETDVGTSDKAKCQHQKKSGKGSSDLYDHFDVCLDQSNKTPSVPILQPITPCKVERLYDQLTAKGTVNRSSTRSLYHTRAKTRDKSIIDSENLTQSASQETAQTPTPVVSAPLIVIPSSYQHQGFS